MTHTEGCLHQPGDAQGGKAWEESETETEERGAESKEKGQGKNKLGVQREQRCMKRERRRMGKNKRRRARGINSGSSQFRVTPQLIVQVRWSQVSSSNRRPLGISAVTEQLRPPSLSSVFHQPGLARSKQSDASFSHNSLKYSSRQNVTLLIE